MPPTIEVPLCDRGHPQSQPGLGLQMADDDQRDPDEAEDHKETSEPQSGEDMPTRKSDGWKAYIIGRGTTGPSR